MFGDSLPAEVVRSIEKDCHAFVFFDQLAISFKHPSSAAECNYAWLQSIENDLKGGGLSIPEGGLALLPDYFRDARILLRRNDSVQIDHAAAETRREGCSDGGLSATHETDDDDATIFHTVNPGALPAAPRLDLPES